MYTSRTRPYRCMTKHMSQMHTDIVQDSMHKYAQACCTYCCSLKAPRMHKHASTQEITKNNALEKKKWYLFVSLTHSLSHTWTGTTWNAITQHLTLSLLDWRIKSTRLKGPRNKSFRSAAVQTTQRDTRICSESAGTLLKGYVHHRVSSATAKTANKDN